MEKTELLKIARGELCAELVYKNVNVVDVYSETTFVADVAIHQGVIAGVGEYKGQVEVDLSGKYICPGLIDSHVHIESSMVVPSQFAKHVLTHGTTTVIADPHEIANVAGLEGVKYMLENSENAVANIYFVLPSCVPISEMDKGGAELTIEDMRQLINNPKVVGLGEVMSFFDAIYGDEKTLQKIELFKNMTVDGHSPGLSGNLLQAYRLSGVMDDHECSTFEAAIERIRAGFIVQIRNGSAAKNLEAILKPAFEAGIAVDRFVMCTDDKHLDSIAKEGHIDFNVKLAIKIGYKPETAIKMATLNAANLYNLKDVGAVSVGKKADLIILDDLAGFNIVEVLKDGMPANNLISNIPTERLPETHPLKNSVHVESVNKDSIQIKTHSEFPVINLVKDEIITKLSWEKLPVNLDGEFAPQNDLLKIVVVNRHASSEKVGVGAIRGFGFKGGAFASTIAHDTHNMVVVGDNDADIIFAIKSLAKIKGGYILVSNEKVVGELPLPLAGLMTDDENIDIGEQVTKICEIARQFGVVQGVDPFQNLSFASLTVIPEVRLTDSGVFTFADRKYHKFLP